MKSMNIPNTHSVDHHDDPDNRMSEFSLISYQRGRKMHVAQ